jgi:hypothetical protein
VKLGACNGRVGNENIPQAVPGHDLGFADLGACDSSGTRLHLPVSQSGYLVRLGMGPVAYSGRAADLRGAFDIPGHDVHINQRCRGSKLSDIHVEP